MFTKLLGALPVVLFLGLSFSFAQSASEAPVSGPTDKAIVQTPSENTTSENTPTETTCAGFEGARQKNGVVWCGTEPLLPFKLLAERSAPILWFSPDEPLLKNGYKIPQPLPCEPSAESLDCSGAPCKNGNYCGRHRKDESAVVYYQVRRIVRPHASTNDTFDGKILKLQNIERLALRYYFYYCVDCGFGGHRHDLENIELIIVIERDKSASRYRARVEEVIGAAHGVHWFNNRLRVNENTVFPITILVERGKHASAPDNDGGGTYEHKVDINKRVRDGWGLRDKLADRTLVPLFPRYLKRHSDQTRPDKRDYRIGSRAQTESHPDVIANYKVKRPNDQDLKEPALYDLKELGCDCVTAKGEMNCTARKVKDVVGENDGMNLPQVLAKRGAGEDPAVATSPSKLVRLFRSSFLMEEDDSLPENLWVKTLQFSYRWDQSHGFALTPPLPTGRLFQGYFVPRAHLTGFSNGSRRYGLDYLYTPSASLWADFYVAGGLEWYREAPGRRFKFGPAWEAGLKFRFPVPGKWKLFAGVRIGVRTSPTKKFSIINETGGGLF